MPVFGRSVGRHQTWTEGKKFQKGKKAHLPQKRTRKHKKVPKPLEPTAVQWYAMVKEKLGEGREDSPKQEVALIQTQQNALETC
jgi:hypothetical protein